MDESTFETFDEELGQVSPPKPLRASRTANRAEMYAQRRAREEAPAVQQVPKTLPREHPASSAIKVHPHSPGPVYCCGDKPSMRKALSIQNLAHIETPWESVTLNRCLIVAISILVLSSGLQRLNEALRGRKDASEELAVLSERHTLTRRGKLPPHEPETSLWDTLFWWVADDDDDEDSGKGKSRRAIQKRVSRGFRHRALPDQRLLKHRETKFTERRGRRETGEKTDRLKEKKQKEIKVKKELEEEKMEKSKRKAVKESKLKSRMKQ